MTILWWHWLVFGLVLVAWELAAPGGFYIIFFGAAAILVGLLSVVGMAGPLWVQLLLFSVLSIGSLWYFRSRLMAIFQRGSPDEPVDALVGQSCRTLGALAPRGAGQVELRGSAWAALNGTDRAIALDARCRVVHINGLTLHVEPEGGSV